jgi:hypothetical protein
MVAVGRVTLGLAELAGPTAARSVADGSATDDATGNARPETSTVPTIRTATIPVAARNRRVRRRWFGWMITCGPYIQRPPDRRPFVFGHKNWWATLDSNQ